MHLYDLVLNKDAHKKVKNISKKTHGNKDLIKDDIKISDSKVLFEKILNIDSMDARETFNNKNYKVVKPNNTILADGK